MAMFPAGRETDPVTHDVPRSGEVGPPQVGPCGQAAVLMDGLTAAHVYCAVKCSGVSNAGLAHPPPPKTPIMMSGSSTVLIHGVPATRVQPSGDVSSCGAYIAPPGSPMVLIGGPAEDPTSARCLARTVMKAGGSGTLADCDLVAAEMGRLPPDVVQRFMDANITAVACRNSVTDYWTHLQGVQPRGWPPGSTWDDVPGAGGGNEFVVAVIGHGTPAGPHVPATGEGHGSSNLVIHEGFHSLDASTGQPSANDVAFNDARDADAATLDAYESQAGVAGQQETYAESAARYYSGDPADAAAHPELHEYWASDPLSP